MTKKHTLGATVLGAGLCLAAGAGLVRAADVQGGGGSAGAPPNKAPVSFADPADAFNQWSATSNAALRKAAVAYLERQVANQSVDYVAARAATERLVKIYEQTGTADKAVELWEQQLVAGLDINLAESLPVWLSPPSLIKARGMLGNPRAAARPQFLWVATVGAAAEIAGRVGRPQEAIQTLDRGLEVLPTNEVPGRLSLMLAKAGIYKKNLGDLATAESLYKTVFDADRWWEARWAGVWDLVDIYRQTGRSAEALAFLLKHAVPLARLDSQHLMDSVMEFSGSAQDRARSAAAIQSLIVEGAANSEAIGRYQPCVVKLLTLGEQPQHALQEARVLYYGCADNALPAAAEAVAFAFKVTDQNLARANAFLRFARYGAAGEDGKLGTTDDVKNPFDDVPPLKDEGRSKAVGDLIRGLARDWSGYKKMGELQIYLDQPADAFKAFKTSFQLCPMSTNELQAVTDALSGLVIRGTGDRGLADSLVQHLMFGEAGPDGRKGTADDLKDPSAEIVQRLEHGSGAKAAVE